ncbi:putative aarF domain-containing protein kinase 1 [Desmophyllum pertusum]|uniref:AarF domain-containing protein kinase 1 n=1 Tax=Desmophyllum pertusum TaxID=174260 RepID=A0A9W9YTX5_9CNID|nr:putative aarF domain-containing protein kinase 1 [Desmophyllum pertusum]
MRLLRKSLGYATISAGLAGVTVALVYGPEELRRKITSNGLVRVGRAARTVVIISYDYKRTLWGIDSNSTEYAELISQAHLRSALSLRDLCCVNGGAYIKVGQYVGSLDYLLPPEYVQTMKVLHSDAPQSPLSDIHHVIEEELNCKVNEVFASFEDKPIGAASLAQVHKATLHDGSVVAVKVQHRDVQKHAAVDMTTLELLAEAVSWLFPEFKFMWLVDESKKHLPLELDFECEGRNAEKITRFFKKFPFVKIPGIYWQFSTKRVLTMEFCDGGKVDDLPYMKNHKISSDEVAHKLGVLYSEMIFVNGYIHCDPHPGNILVRRNPQNGVEIVFLDHGLYQTLSSDFRINYCKMWQSLIKSDLEGIKQSSKALGVEEMYGLLACILTARSWDVITTGIDQGPVTDDEAEEIRANATTFLTAITDLLNRVPRQLLLLLKTNDLLRSIDYRLNTSATSCSFITTSRCCIRAVTKQRLKDCDGWKDWVRIQADSTFSHLRITLYQMYVSGVVTSLRRLFSRLMGRLSFL